MTFEGISIAVQIEGKLYFVVMPKADLELVLDMAAGLTDNGALKLAPAPDGFRFATIGELKGEN